MDRRRFLRFSAGAGVAIAAGGSLLVWSRPEQGGHELIWRSVAIAVLDGVLPREPKDQDRALAAHLTRIRAAVSALSPATQAELGELLDILLTAPGRKLLAGVAKPWAVASQQEVWAGLDAMRTSGLAVRQQAFHALRDLTNAAYFSDEEGWAIIGYPGPQPI